MFGRATGDGMSAVLHDSGISLAAEPRAAKAPRTGGSTLRTKLLAMVALAVLLLVGVQSWSIYSERQLMIATKQTEITSVAQSAWGVVNHFYQQQQAGKLSQEAAQAAAIESLMGMRYGGTDGRSEYIFVTASTGIIVMNGGNPSFAGSNSITRSGDKRDPTAVMAERIAAMRAGGGTSFINIQFVRPGGTEPSPKLNIYKLHEPWGWAIGTGVFMDDLQQMVRERIINGAILAVILTLILLAGGWVISRKVLSQIGGEPSDVIAVMNRAAHGDLSQPLPDSTPGSVLHGFATMSGSVRGLISKVRDEAVEMKRDSQRIAESVAQVTAASSAQSDATSSMAAAVEELTVSVAHISDAATETQRNSEGVAQKCRDGEVQVTGAADGMKRIATAVGEASEKIRGLEARALQINSIAASIKEIAGQTNLLALNAAIEAARAGEQGRGFSVVADEVRKLAERTSSATVEIEEMVSAVQRETSESTETMEHILPMVTEGTQLADQVAVSLREIRLSADASLERVREVANATKEQSAASTSIAQQVESIAQMVEETTAAMGETARSAQEMRDMAERLDRLVGTFKV
jgi:methyl-accepting chemotaxis protein